MKTLRSLFFTAVALILAVLPQVVLACPYCTGQSGENYIKTIMMPVVTLLSAPFFVFGVIGLILFKHQKGEKNGEEDKIS
ncbi:MAG: hypothetical protein QF551_02705 [Candidatus Marinimicrobia bacterium]|nr:hypothetical protein [Candidatus Neomarinimicrobiota bacterium]